MARAWWQESPAQPNYAKKQRWQEEQRWQCRTSGCHSWNQVAAKKCKGCGLKKSWAQVVQSDKVEAPPPWAQRTTTLDSAVGPTTSYTAATAPQIDHNVKIKSLENAMAALPPGDEFQPTREILAKQIQEAKGNVTLSKPLSSQLVSRRSAVERADKRLADSQKTLAKAQGEVSQAAVESEQRKTELQELEAKALQVNAPNSLEASTQSLSRVIADMKSSTVIPQATLREAETEIMRLLAGLQRIATEANAQLTPAQKNA
ncbi:unnamed protein product, partial [Prorocentrum cordatum]